MSYRGTYQLIKPLKPAQATRPLTKRQIRPYLMVYCSLCNIAQCFEEEAPMLMPEDITAFSPALSTVEDLESRTKSQKTDNIDGRMKEAVV